MSLLRILVERAVVWLFGLVALAAIVQGLSVLPAALAVMMMPGRPETPSWAIRPLIEGALLSLVLVAGGALHGMVKARHRSALSGNGEDESIRLEWIGPATIPTLLFPAVAVLLSAKLFELCRAYIPLLSKYVVPGLSRGADPFAGLVLLPAAAVLFVPVLESVAAFFLIAAPPLMLLLLSLRSRSFRVTCQLVAVAQVTWVGASLVGADLYRHLVTLATPVVQKAGGSEAVLVLEFMNRGRDVLMSTALGYAAVAAAYMAGLWVLRTVHVEAPSLPAMTPELEPTAEPLAPEPSPTPEAPPSRPAGLEEVLAQYRARHSRRP